MKPASPTQIKSFLSNEMKDHDVLLTLDAISPMWAKKLEESKQLPLLSIRGCSCMLNLNILQSVLEKHMAFPHLMYLILRLLGKFMFYFMICSYSKSEATKKEFVKHWSEKHYYHYTFR